MFEIDFKSFVFIASIFLSAKLHKAGHRVEVPRCGCNFQILFKEIIGELGVAQSGGVERVNGIVNHP